jgi:hypothetical protein
MTTKPPQELVLHEDSNIRLNLKGLWALVVAVFLAGGAVVHYQLRTQYQIERLHLQNQAEHAALMVKLSEIDTRQGLFVLKRQVEDALVFVNHLRDSATSPNAALVGDELEFRRQLQTFLK